MIHILTAIIVLATSPMVYAGPTAEQPDRNNEIYNLQGELGLKGYDPVSYFPEGGGAPLEGSTDITGVYGGVTYHFANQDHKDLFFSNPTKYEPTYGGWCAWAMANDAYADINPQLFTLNGNRSHFFISQGAKARFDLSLETREQDADDFWKQESGEDPRL